MHPFLIALHPMSIPLYTYYPLRTLALSSLQQRGSESEKQLEDTFLALPIGNISQIGMLWKLSPTDFVPTSWSVKVCSWFLLISLTAVLLHPHNYVQRCLTVACTRPECSSWFVCDKCKHQNTEITTDSSPGGVCTRFWWEFPFPRASMHTHTHTHTHTPHTHIYTHTHTNIHTLIPPRCIYTWSDLQATSGIFLLISNKTLNWEGLKTHSGS